MLAVSKGAGPLVFLAQDDKLMKLADDFYKDFEKGFNKVMRMGKNYSFARCIGLIFESGKLSKHPIKDYPIIIR